MQALSELERQAPADTPQRELVVEARGVTKSFGGTRVLDGLSLEVERGEFVSVVGPSGCGKTTLLRMLGGLSDADAGDIAIAGTRVDGPPPGCVYVFQNYQESLLGWRTVLRNVTFPLEGRMGKAERLERARHYLSVVGLASAESRYPRQLSGGMQQRVAIARALAVEAPVMLFDEPFGAVDAQTRMSLQDELLQLCASLGKTVVFITHDIDEAVYLADRVLVLREPGEAPMEVPVPLPRPRDQVDTKAERVFVELRGQLLRTLTGRTAAPVERAG